MLHLASIDFGLVGLDLQYLFQKGPKNPPFGLDDVDDSLSLCREPQELVLVFANKVLPLERLESERRASPGDFEMSSDIRHPGVAVNGHQLTDCRQVMGNAMADLVGFELFPDLFRQFRIRLF
jgi:hypothetical protein